ncbi:MAG: YcfL family protein [Kiritimatiellaeota bacterium]|nr:YcfL family protein [Kiritimatiellota bacterium]
MKKIRSLALTALALGALTGCVDTAGTVVTTDHRTGESIIVEDSTRVRDRVQLVDLKYDEINGFQRAHFSIASTKLGRLYMDYRVVWFDESGRELDPQSRTYKTVILEGRDVTTITSVANRPTAVASKLRIRETRSSQ